MINFSAPHIAAGLAPSEPILLALSGGSDSVTLLDLLAKYSKSVGCRLYAAHVDHGIRENEHERDRMFCRALAEKYEIEIFVLEADIPKIAKESGESEELAARRVRYDFFADIMKKNGIGILATAHNADDNLETVIFNLTRGSGIRGLCGIPPVREFEGGIIVRPILGATKDEIFEYCRKNELAYVTDCTNFDDSYSRNRIRLNVIPELKKLNTAAAKNITKLCSSLSADRDFIESEARKYIEADGSVKLSGLSDAPDALLPHIISCAFEAGTGGTLEAVHIEALIELCKKAKSFSSVSLPLSMMGRIEKGYLRFSADKKAAGDNNFYEIKLKEGKNMLDRHILLYVSPQNDKNIYKSAIRMAIDSDKIIGEMYARCRLPGDKILMNGMHKDLRRLISAKKILPELRASLPVICDDMGVLCVPFIGVRDGAKAGENSKFIYIDIQNINASGDAEARKTNQGGTK